MLWAPPSPSPSVSHCVHFAGLTLSWLTPSHLLLAVVKPLWDISSFRYINTSMCISSGGLFLTWPLYLQEHFTGLNVFLLPIYQSSNHFKADGLMENHQKVQASCQSFWWVHAAAPARVKIRLRNHPHHVHVSWKHSTWGRGNLSECLGHKGKQSWTVLGTIASVRLSVAIMIEVCPPHWRDHV